MSKKSNRIIALGIILFTLIAIFVLFARAFGDMDTDTPSVYGSVFNVIFGKKNSIGDVLYKPVGGLLAAFILYCVVFLASFVAMAFIGKQAALIYGIIAVALIVCGILFLCAPKLFIAVNKVTSNPTLGVGCITTSIFAFLGGVTALYGAYSNFKA